jgi:hypothetical protein
LNALFTARKTPLLERVNLSRNSLTSAFSKQLTDTLVTVIEEAKHEAMQLVSTHANNGDLGNLNLQFDTLAHISLVKLDLS